jgi:hypothetical protein
MTDETRRGNQAVKAIVKGVATKTALLVAAGTAAFLGYAFFRGADQRWWFLPVSVLSGGILGLLNFRWLAIAVERVYLRQGASAGLSNLAAVIISVLKLSLIFIVLFVVIKTQLLNIFGLVAGLSFCFLAILWEGVVMMKYNLMNKEK